MGATRAATAPSAARFLAYGRRLFDDSPALMPRYVKAGLSCSACHIAGGTQPHALSLRGSYAAFPRWNVRAGRFIAVQDRIAECFLYSMNGKPPAYDSREMIALTAYIAELSRGVPLGTRLHGQALVPVQAEPANRARGAAVFAARCVVCHSANGATGASAGPPLWGPRSFTTGAGMHRRDVLSAFIRFAMPLGTPNVLSPQQAGDVAAFVLGHRRPPFHGHAPIIFRPEPARFF